MGTDEAGGVNIQLTSMDASTYHILDDKRFPHCH